jgi:hypothetical protein
MSSEFIRSPQFDNWLHSHKPKNSVLICSPYIKKYALDKIIKEYGFDNKKSSVKVKVLIRGKLEDFLHGSSDLSCLETLSKLSNVDAGGITRLTNLHMKAYLLDEKSLLIGSGNFTQRGLFFNNGWGNIEGAIATTEDRIIKEFKGYYNEITKYSEPLEKFYSNMIESYKQYIEKGSVNAKISNMIASSIKNDELSSAYTGNFKGTEIVLQEVPIITAEMVPQFSNFKDGTNEVVEILTKQGNPGLTFVQLGILLEGPGKTDMAYRKYGENHSKLAELLDLVTISNTRPRKIYLTSLGEMYHKVDNKNRIEIIKTQIFRMHLVRYIIMNYNNSLFNLSGDLQTSLKESTTDRRMSNIKALFKFLQDNGVGEAELILDKL